jgi:hypothetical protein
MGHFLKQEIFCKRLNSDIVALLRMQFKDTQCGDIIYKVVSNMHQKSSTPSTSTYSKINHLRQLNTVKSRIQTRLV